MTAHLLAELADLFSREAFDADRHGNADEAERFWDVANELHARCEAALRREGER